MKLACHPLRKALLLNSCHQCAASWKAQKSPLPPPACYDGTCRRFFMDKYLKLVAKATIPCYNGPHVYTEVFDCDPSGKNLQVRHLAYFAALQFGKKRRKRRLRGRTQHRRTAVMQDQLRDCAQARFQKFGREHLRFVKRCLQCYEACGILRFYWRTAIRKTARLSSRRQACPSFRWPAFS